MLRQVFRAILFFMAIGVVSCTIQKRKYFPGFYKFSPGKITHTGASTHALSEHAFAGADTTLVEVPAPAKAKPVEYSTAASQKIPAAATRKFLKRNSQPVAQTDTTHKDSCDRIITAKGDTIECKIQLVDVDVIKYKRCDFQNGPLYAIGKEEVVKIIFSNGITENVAYRKVPDQNDKNNQLALIGALCAFAGVVFTVLFFFAPFYFFPEAFILLGIAGLIAGLVLGIIVLARCDKNGGSKNTKLLAFLAMLPAILTALLYALALRYF